MTRRRMRFTTVLPMVAAMLIGWTGCENPNDTGGEGTYYGETKQMGNGTARSFVRLDADGNPVEVGLVMSETALMGLPEDSDGHDPNNSINIRFPAQASKTPYKHIELDWNPGGHPPGVYLLPHFDVHFYMMTPEQKMGMPGTGPDSLKMLNPPAAEHVPSGYINTHEAVPFMGVHWVDPTSDEFQPGKIFTKTLIYGYYDAGLIFTEPMITKAFFESKPNFTEAIKQPASYQKTGLYYPSKYNIRFDTTTKEYIVSLSGMALR